MSVATYAGLSQEVRDRDVGELQPLLADLIALSLQGKQLHWNVTGPLFSPVHTQLDKIVDDARVWSDDVAERMVAIDVPANGQATDVVKESSLAPLAGGSITDRQAISLIAGRVAAVTSRSRLSMDRLGELDLASQDLVIEIVRGLEKHLWMLRAQEQ